MLKPRMNHPAMILPEAMQHLQALGKATERSGYGRKRLAWCSCAPAKSMDVACAWICNAQFMKKAGETDERLFAVAAWRDTPYFNDAERSALALTEAMTRLSDRPDPMPDEIWNEAARHYGERELSGLLTAIALINVWNRLNAATRQVAGEWMKSEEARKWVEAGSAAH